MSYLHCHTCHWSQDDFWDQNYNPITFLEKNYTEEILNKDLWEVIKLDTFDDKRGRFIGMNSMTRENFICGEIEWALRRIKKMIYRTHQEYKEKNPEWRCPNCWNKDLDID